MTGLKDAYQSGEENHLGNTGQVRMDVKVVRAPVMSAQVIYAAVNQAPTRTALAIGDCEDTLNALGNCYACNKPMKRDCPKQTQAITENRRETLAVIIAKRKDTKPETAGHRGRIEKEKLL